MTTDGASRLEAVILRDADGSIYAVPRPALARWRLPSDLAASYAEPEVSGYLNPIGGLQVIGKATGEADTNEVTRVRFTFQKISFTVDVGNKMAVDDWLAQ